LDRKIWKTWRVSKLENKNSPTINLTTNNDSKTNNIISIKLDGDSLIWFGSESGVHIYKKNENIDDNRSWDFLTIKGGVLMKKGDAGICFHDNVIWWYKHMVCYWWVCYPQWTTEIQYRGEFMNLTVKFKWRISKEDGLTRNGIILSWANRQLIWSGVYSFDKKNKKEYGKGLVYINRLNNKVYTVDLKCSKYKHVTYSLFFILTMKISG